MTASGNLIEFDQSHFLKQFSGALTLFDTALETARQIGEQPIHKIFFVGCGAPHHLFYSLEYWASKYATNTTFYRYFPAEFVAHAPQGLDENSLVILGSHSGTTKETVQAAQFVQQTPAQSLAITQSADSPLGQAVDHTFAYGSTEQGYFSAFMLTFAFLSGFLAQKEPDWPFHKALMASLPNFPAALAEAKAQTLSAAAHQAEALKDSQPLYVLGAGPMYTTAYVFASCFLMEMQWMHAHPLQAAEFFHGPFEVVDGTTPLLLLIGEDPSRPIAERVLEFTKQYSHNTIVYDSKQFPMTCIAPEIRPLVAPMIVDAALTNLVETLAVLRNHPMATRRYMGKVVY
jgi:fructoselysine 6-phosphate deglycase